MNDDIAALDRRLVALESRETLLVLLERKETRRWCLFVWSVSSLASGILVSKDTWPQAREHYSDDPPIMLTTAAVWRQGDTWSASCMFANVQVDGHPTRESAIEDLKAAIDGSNLEVRSA